MAEARFAPVGSQMPFRELEERLRARWKEREVFRRSVEAEPERPLYSFYEGPPTANGAPGVHHVLSRVFKDLFPRYKTMRGYRVPRKGGWDTHGLPVELEVERELGLQSKAEIETYGIAEFNAKCRESVFRYVRQWEDLTERVAFWLDLHDAYITYTPQYIESCWWIIKQLWDAGLIYEDRRTTPHCPRCETSLSSHELALGYRENTPDPSLTVKFLTARASLPGSLRDYAGPTSLLAWTTTPWTLPGNSALAVDPDARYAVVAGSQGERLILAEALVAATLEGETAVEQTLPGRDLVGVTYEGLYEPGDWGLPLSRFEEGRLVGWSGPGEAAPWRRVVEADFVSMEEGTGIVHVAPAFGADDYVLGRREGLAFLQPVDLQGRMTGPSSPFRGLFVKDADARILEDLKRRGLLAHHTTIHHTYPFCWRCETPLLYYAKPSWYIATTKVLKSLRRSNRELIHWHPEHLRDGRYGDWLANNVDWAISRERYWGTPLPIWRCQGCDGAEAVGSFDELRNRARQGEALDLSDPHRPFIDEVVLDCPTCRGEMRRIPEVADAWFDSGAMPYAQWHYPFENAEAFGAHFPADFICEGVDQTRGWFYSLHAEATLLHAAGATPEPTAYRHVMSLGHILDEAGEKMSKSKGNVVDPWQVLDDHGADALRWYLYTASPPGNSRRFGSHLVGDVQRRFLLRLWNTYSFFVTYANIDGFDPGGPAPVQRPDLDRWIRSALHGLIGRVTAALEEYEPTVAARAIEEFVEQLSNWYVRRSRRRFWKPVDDQDKAAAYHTLYECLVTVSHLLAPFTPYVADEIYGNLVVRRDHDAPDSVHLARWPEADAALIDDDLDRAMPLVQRLASLGRAARSRAGVKVRQPLAELLVSLRAPGDAAALEQHTAMLLDELNVKRITLVDEPTELVQAVIKPNLPVLGPRLGSDLGRLRTALQGLTPDQAAAIARAVTAAEPVEVAGFSLGAGDLLVELREREGVSAAQDAHYAAAVSTAITPELAREGTAREVVHRVQRLRRDAGLEITDRIALWIDAGPPVADAVAAHRDYVQTETLATDLRAGPPPDGARASEERIEGERVIVAVRRL